MTTSFSSKVIFNRYSRWGRKTLLRTSIYSYRQIKQSAMSGWKLAVTPVFRRLLNAISNGREFNVDDLLPFLCMESKEDRLWVNFCLAKAFHKSGKHAQAKIFIQRVWSFSEHSEEYLSLFIAIHAASGDIDSIRDAYKALGIKKAAEKKISNALTYFNNWQYAYSVFNKADEYHYDFDVLHQIESLAAPYAYPPSKVVDVKQRKIRLAYLMFGMTHLNSVIVRNSLTFAMFHDASVFDVEFFIPDQATSVYERKEAVGNIEKIRNFGWGVTVAPDAFSELASLLDIASSIHEFKPDILVTNAGLADFRHFFIAALRPAPFTIGLCQGPPPQFVAPSFDWSISWTKHPMLDCPTGCSLVNGAMVLPERKISAQEAKIQFGMPDNEFVFMSCGRLSKFQEQGVWVAILDILRTHANTSYVVVGLDAPPLFLEPLLTSDIAERVKFVGWTKDFYALLSMADVVIDTYPSGGGGTVVDAMALGIPVVSFKNNYMQMFSQTDWSPAEEFMGMPELLVERENFSQLADLLKKLLTDQEFRDAMSGVCRERIHETTGSAQKMVRDCEQVYLNVLKASTPSMDEV